MGGREGMTETYEVAGIEKTFDDARASRACSTDDENQWPFVGHGGDEYEVCGGRR